MTGQTVWANKSTALYEVGNFLGGGAAGTVYEAEHVKSKEHFALKILTPLGYKLLSPALLRRCSVISKGKPVSDAVEQSEEPLKSEHVWWLLNGSTKQYLAAYYSERNCTLRELSLKQCMSIWGSQPSVSENDEDRIEILQTADGTRVYVPVIPPKYAEFVKRRSRIFREILNMRKISNHRNVIRLENVLELTQESKCTIFLVMELANGGELFDRIKIDCGTREETAVLYFIQLLDGVQHCHEVGVCHRDLKPENLLLQDSPGNGTVLKVFCCCGTKYLLCSNPSLTILFLDRRFWILCICFCLCIGRQLGWQCSSTKTRSAATSLRCWYTSCIGFVWRYGPQWFYGESSSSVSWIPVETAYLCCWKSVLRCT